MGTRTKERKRKMDILQAEEVKEQTTSGKFVNNEPFYQETIVPMMEKMFQAAKDNDEDTFSEFFERKSQVEFLEGKKNDIYMSFSILKQLSEKYEMQVAPYWEFVLEGSTNFKKNDLAARIGQPGEYLSFTVGITAIVDEKNRITNPGLDFTAVIDKEGKFFVKSASYWDASSVVGFNGRAAA